MRVEPSRSHGRVACPSCGGEQERLRAEDSQRCVICGETFQRFLVERSPVQRKNALADAAEPLFRQAPSTGPGPEIRSVLAADKRLISMLAFVPVWGLRQLSHSADHTRREKYRLAAASVGVTMLLGIGVWMITPNADQRADRAHAAARKRIEMLAGLVQEYRREHGALPDEAAWRRSAANADLRFYDRWGRVYRYEVRDEGFVIASFGRDGTPGGKGEDADLSIEFPLHTKGVIRTEE